MKNIFNPVLIRTLILFEIIFFLLSGQSICQFNKNSERNYMYYDYKLLDTSNVFGGFSNVGSTGFPYHIGWREINPQIITYDYGIHVIGKIDNYPHLALNQWQSAYSPGPIIDGEAAMLIHPEDSLRYRVYKISKGDDYSNPDYAEWPVDFGAPIDENGNPLFYGDQTLWTAYNALDSTVEYRIFWNEVRDSLPIMPIEVQQLVYSRSGYNSDYVDIFSNTVFFEFKILNKSSVTIDSTFIGFWTDIDFCHPSSNPPGVDTSLQAGYCWTTDSAFCSVSPAVGYAMLYGPLVESPGDTANFGKTRKVNYRNSIMSSFYPVAQDAHPHFDAYFNLEGAWNVARGLYENGTPIINPLTNQVTKFPLDGDPVTNDGWIWTNNTNGEAGFYLFTGPFTLTPNDSQWMMIALVPSLGRNNLESISLMRQKIELLKGLDYDSLAFGRTSLFVTSVEGEDDKSLPKIFELSQNFPNPFNPSTKIEYKIPERGFVTLKVYDVLGNEVATLVNEEKPAGSYEVEFNSVSGIRYPASGIYFYQLKAGEFIQTKKMILLR